MNMTYSWIMLENSPMILHYFKTASAHCIFSLCLRPSYYMCYARVVLTRGNYYCSLGIFFFLENCWAQLGSIFPGNCLRILSLWMSEQADVLACPASICCSAHYTRVPQWWLAVVTKEVAHFEMGTSFLKLYCIIFTGWVGFVIHQSIAAVCGEFMQRSS